MKRMVCVCLAALLLCLVGCDAGNRAEQHTSGLAEPTESIATAETEHSAAAYPMEDEPLNVLFVSNSTCNYFRDELLGMLEAAGYQDVNLCLTYYSGCRVQQHYEWWLKDEHNYDFRICSSQGTKNYEAYSLQGALDYADWDIISFDNSARTFASGDVKTSFALIEPYFGKLLEDIRAQKPNARYFWHEVWSNEVGYEIAFVMSSVEQRTQVFNAKHGVMELVCDTYGVEPVPTGDAWEKVRDLPLFTEAQSWSGLDRFTLCTRIAGGKLTDDYTHDGDVGGGQYLNACVWFEVITGRSCVGNTFRPVYTLQGQDVSLSEEKIAILQQAAHEAVQELGY